MSKKPDRPLMAVRFGDPALVVEGFPADKEALEIAWAQRFTEALQKQNMPHYMVVGRAPDPGDVLLRRKGEPDIYLQVTEAVDLRRIQSDGMRRSYMRAISETNTRLKSAFSGIQIFLSDDGQMLKLPNPQSKAGLAVAAAMSKFILDLEPRLATLPICPPGGWPHPRQAMNFQDPSSAVSITVFLTRYALAGATAPAHELEGRVVELITRELEQR